MYNNGQQPYGQPQGYPQQPQQYQQPQGYPQQPQQQQYQQKPQLNPATSFKVSADLKQSKFPDRVTGQIGQYLQVSIKYAAKQDKGADFSIALNFAPTKFGTVGGYTVVDVHKLEQLYRAIGFALSQLGSPVVAPQYPQQQLPQAPQYQPQPQQPVIQPTPQLNSYTEVLALVNWDNNAAISYCNTNRLQHLIPPAVTQPNPNVNDNTDEVVPF